MVEELEEKLERVKYDMERVESEVEGKVLRAQEEVRQVLQRSHECELETWDQLIEMLTKRVEQLESRVMTKETEDDGGKGTKADQASHGMKLPGLTYFCGDESDDIDAFGQWVCKLEWVAEICKWSEEEKLIQHKLLLSSRAERLYDVLLDKAKATF